MTAFPPLKWSETLRVNPGQPAYRGAGRTKASASLWALRERLLRGIQTTAASVAAGSFAGSQVQMTTGRIAT